MYIVWSFFWLFSYYFWEINNNKWNKNIQKRRKWLKRKINNPADFLVCWMRKIFLDLKLNHLNLISKSAYICKSFIVQTLLLDHSFEMLVRFVVKLKAIVCFIQRVSEFLGIVHTLSQQFLHFPNTRIDKPSESVKASSAFIITFSILSIVSRFLSAF